LKGSWLCLNWPKQFATNIKLWGEPIDRRLAALRPAFADSIATNVFIFFNEQGRDFGKSSFAEELAEGFDEILVVLV
jgi:hypothetical protein